MALAEYVRLRDPSAAEVAFTVADELQGRGAATRLLEQLAPRAAAAGIDALRRHGHVGELADARRVPRRRVRGDAPPRRRRGRGALPDRVDRALRRERRGSRSHRGRRLAARVLRTRDRRRGRGLAAARLDRGRALPEHPRGRLLGRRLPGEQERRAGGRSSRVRRHRADPGARRPRRDLRPRRGRARRRGSGAPGGCAVALRHLGGLRRGRRRGRRAPGSAARRPPRARRATRRAELPRHRDPADRAERDVRAARPPAGTHRLLLAERRPRARHAREGDRARPRLLVLRLDRQQGRRLVQRPARVVGGGRVDGRGPSLPRVVREPAQVRPSRRARSPAQADPRHQGRPHERRRTRRQLAHGRARRLGRRRGGAVPPGGRPARPHARGADRPRDAALARRCAPGAARRRGHERRRARDPLRGRVRRSRARAARARSRDPGGPARGSAGRGCGDEPHRLPRVGDGPDVRAGAAARPPRPRRRRRDRAVRAAGRRRSRRGRRGDPCRRRAGAVGEAAARGRS